MRSKACVVIVRVVYLRSPAHLQEDTRMRSKGCVVIVRVVYLRSPAHLQEATHGMEGTRPTHVQVGLVQWLQHLHKVGTLPLLCRQTHRERDRDRKNGLQLHNSI